MKVILEQGAYALSRAHQADAGLDIRAMEGGTIKAFASKTFRTGVHVQIPHDCCGLLVSKSGLNIKEDITSTGLIDEGYTGEILVKLYNHSALSYRVEAGDKISQLVILPVIKEPVIVTDRFDETERGSNGFGSTGR